MVRLENLCILHEAAYQQKGNTKKKSFLMRDVMPSWSQEQAQLPLPQNDQDDWEPSQTPLCATNNPN